MTEPSIAMAGAAPAEFRIGGIFGRSFTILSQDFVPFVLLTGLATSPTFLLAVGTQGKAHPGWTIAAALLLFVLAKLSEAFILYGAFQQMLGRRFSTGESLAVALARFLPIIGLSICVGIAVFFGLLLLIVPGIIWALMWSIGVPVCVVERLGPFQSMGRSAALTKGHRWKIFGIVLVLWLLNMIVQAGLTRILAAVAGALAASLVLWVWSALYTAFYAIVIVTVYHDLRVAKEGVDTEQIAAVFA